MTRFQDLGLIPPLLEALAAEGYEHPTPIQAAAIPHALTGRDILGCAQTGTGKTAAFALPILQQLSAEPIPTPRAARALVLAPTRELATQIEERFTAYGKSTGLRSTVIYGGMAQGPQVRAVRAGLDVIVATPGRLLDLMGQMVVSLGTIRFLVLDEADRMLDMGFLPDVHRILMRVPLRRQTMLYSATLPREILDLVHNNLHDPVKVETSPSSTTVERVKQLVVHVETGRKLRALEKIVFAPGDMRALVFTRTKEGANRVVEQLNRGPYRADVMHADRSQSAREKSLESFKKGDTRVLVATDIVSRGLDVDGVTHVINYDVPDEPEAYVHRIGRTARAGANGIAITLCEPVERRKLSAIEKTIRMEIPVAAGSAPRDAAPPPHGSGGHAPRTSPGGTPAGGSRGGVRGRGRRRGGRGGR